MMRVIGSGLPGKFRKPGPAQWGTAAVAYAAPVEGFASENAR